MKLAVVGTGYVGLVTGTCFAELGNDVICVDIDPRKVEQLNRGTIPIYEPGLEELVTRNHREGRLSFTTDISAALSDALIVFSAVGTPPDQDHKADLSAIKAVAKSFGESLGKDYKILVNKSTVPVGTADLCTEIIRNEANEAVNFDVVSNPEFLREGSAVKDCFNPERVIIGAASDRAQAVMEELYTPLTRANVPFIRTSVRNAEITKYASNCFLATKISFINELANFCDHLDDDIDIREIANAMGLDSRIGLRFLHAGIGYGGSCFPKDISALIATGRQHGYHFKIINAVNEVNQQQKRILVHKLRKHIPDLQNKIISLWGLAFKPNTDDMRDSPSIDIIYELTRHGALVQAFDPVASENAERHFAHLSNVTICKTPYDALDGSHALLTVTEWMEFRSPDFDRMKSLMANPLIIDGRNIFDPEKLASLGITLESIGRH